MVTESKAEEGSYLPFLAIFLPFLAINGQFCSFSRVSQMVTAVTDGPRWSQVVTVGHRIGEGWVRPWRGPLGGSRASIFCYTSALPPTHTYTRSTTPPPIHPSTLFVWLGAGAPHCLAKPSSHVLAHCLPPRSGSISNAASSPRRATESFLVSDRSRGARQTHQPPTRTSGTQGSAAQNAYNDHT